MMAGTLVWPSYSARLATFGQALAKLHPDAADLMPTG
jgi:hypothetical protein